MPCRLTDSTSSGYGAPFAQMKMGKAAPSQSGTPKPHCVSTSDAASQRTPRSYSCFGPVSLQCKM